MGKVGLAGQIMAGLGATPVILPALSSH